LGRIFDVVKNICRKIIKGAKWVYNNRQKIKETAGKVIGAVKENFTSGKQRDEKVLKFYEQSGRTPPSDLNGGHVYDGVTRQWIS
jgi:ABC-type nitrate/sulfonate/bicarbonate transport system substrate-binding protein